MKIFWIGYFRDFLPGARSDDERLAGALERQGATVLRCQHPWHDAERGLSSFAPDWILFSKCQTLGSRRLERLKALAPRIPRAQILFDLMDLSERILPGCPWPVRSRLAWWLPQARHFDLVFMRDRGNFERYARSGVRCVYLDQACDPDEHPADRVSEQATCDVAFLGTFHRDRVGPLHSIASRRHVRVYSGDPGPWRRAGLETRPAVFGTALAEAVAGARIVYGQSARHDIEGYWSDRVYRVLGHRGFFLTRYTPGLETTFVNGEHLVWLHDAAELPELVERYLGEEETRRRIAGSGFRHVRAHHTYDRRAREVLDALERRAPGIASP